MIYAGICFVVGIIGALVLDTVWPLGLSVIGFVVLATVYVRGQKLPLCHDR